VPDVSALLATLVPPLAAAAVAVQRDGREPEFHVAAGPQRRVGPDTLWRAASLSKMVTARTLEAVGGGAIWARDASEALGWPLRHPLHPEAPVTLGLISSHAASLSDEAGYAVPAATCLRDWLAGQGTRAWHPEPPGTRLHYANLGSLLLALAAERLGGDRFDLLARRYVLDPLRLEGGFNWSGVPARRREDRMPALRRDPSGAFHPQVDAAVPPEGIASPLGPPAPPGRNPAPLSPQGGLRLSLRGALSLARTVPPDPPWLRLPGDPMLAGAAPGLILLDDPALHPRPLHGHFADAYGVLAGAWRDPARGLSFAYVLNGLPLGDEAEGWREPERAVFRAVADL
jgi:CubicO group peptidase (beta-lactamase class C family)